MFARITLAPGSPPAEQIREQLRGLISTGLLPANERLPSVRQLASDLGVAAGTVAKVYKSLESERLVVTRIGGGTRVHPDASSTPATVLEAATRLARLGAASGMTLSEVMNALGAVWSEPGAPSNPRQSPSK